MNTIDEYMGLYVLMEGNFQLMLDRRLKSIEQHKGILEAVKADSSELLKARVVEHFKSASGIERNIWENGYIGRIR